MRRRPTPMRGVLAALPLALALVLTGCGDSDDSADVASAGGDKDGRPGSRPSMSMHEMGVKYASCMRKNGVPMEDPEPGKGVLLRSDQAGVDKATLDKAMEACREYQPQAPGGGGPKDGGKMREYAQCMRENGVEKFPDPEGGGIRIDRAIGEDPDFDAAQEQCQDTMAAGQAPSEGR
ncbi:hypothetical protein [Streptomyces sp. NPDC018031]|uniref:hypothetical protein n=1 Tax=Streptomyces sp. NPDC018031 TaxID=3365033 RepID=UPI0037AF6549